MPLLSSKHWRQRATEMQALAAQMANEEAKCAMLRIAESYERLARSAEDADPQERETV